MVEATSTLWRAGIIGAVCLATNVVADVQAQDATSITLMSNAPCVGTVGARVNLSAPAPAAGLILVLTSTLPASVAVPATTAAAPGALSADFTITCTTGDQSVSAAITAVVRGNSSTAKTVVTVLAPVLSAITFPQHTGTRNLTGQVTLAAAAPAGGVVVTLSAPLNFLPSFVTVPAGATRADVVAADRSVISPTTFQVVATGLGVSKTASVTLQPPSPIDVHFRFRAPAMTAEGGATVPVGVTLAMPASIGVLVKISSSNPAVVDVPTEWTVGSNGDSVMSFTVATRPVARPTAVTITATGSGVSQRGVLTVLPPTMTTATATPSVLVGGQIAQGTITYQSPAPATGTVVKLTSSNASLVLVPSTVTVPAGQKDVTFPIQTNQLEGRVQVNVSAESYGTVRTFALDLVSEGPTAISITPGSVLGGGSVKGEVSAVLGDDSFQVDLASGAPNVVSVAPGALSFSKGMTRALFQVNTVAVPRDTSVTISATTTVAPRTVAGFAAISTLRSSTVKRTASLRVLAPVVTGLILPVRVDEASMIPARITLNGIAPVAGFPVTVGYTENGQFYGREFVVAGGATSAVISFRAPSWFSRSDTLGMRVVYTATSPGNSVSETIYVRRLR